MTPDERKLYQTIIDHEALLDRRITALIEAGTALYDYISSDHTDAKGEYIGNNCEGCKSCAKWEELTK